MAEVLKEIYNLAFLQQLSRVLRSAYPDFESDTFVASFKPGDWKKLELFQRVAAISHQLRNFLPEPFELAVDILVKASSEFSRYEYIIFPDFVARFGLSDYKTSINALEKLTCYSTSEFAIRPFIEKYPEKTMKQMLKWSDHKDEHVRRLASEGCRPRLPWASALNDFKQNPTPILPILENLKQDESEYVRRSVANNLNDISKDHPDLVIEITKDWIDQHALTDRLLKHACRTMLKAGEPEVLKLFGYPNPQHIEINDFHADDQVYLNGDFNFSFELRTKNNKPIGQVRVEYELEFVRQGGKTSQKIFKLADNNFPGSSKSFTKQFSFRPLSTRKYYPGEHKLKIFVNGKVFLISEFLLS